MQIVKQNAEPTRAITLSNDGQTTAIIIMTSVITILITALKMPLENPDTPERPGASGISRGPSPRMCSNRLNMGRALSQKLAEQKEMLSSLTLMEFWLAVL